MLEKDLFLRGTILYIYILYIYIYIYIYTCILHYRMNLELVFQTVFVKPARRLTGTQNWRREINHIHPWIGVCTLEVSGSGLYQLSHVRFRYHSVYSSIAIFYIWRFWMYITTYRLMILWLKSYCSWLLLNYIKSIRDMNGHKFTGPKIINCNYIHAARKHKHIINCNYIHAARKHKRFFSNNYMCRK